MRREVLRLEHVTYKENEQVMLQDFDLNIFEGEVMGLLPVGAYGLPAFLKILREYPPLYHGYVYYREKQVDSWVEKRHSNNRISIIGDTSTLVDGQSILTNVMILRRGYRQHYLNYPMLKRQLQIFLDEIEVPLDPQLPVERLTPFERIVVEILRAVVADHRLIVMQEIGTIVSDSEIGKLHKIMQKYKRKGFSFLYISPHFEELLQICDRVALMMDVRIDKVLWKGEMDEKTVNRCSAEYVRRVQENLVQREECRSEIVFSVEELTRQNLKKLCFHVRRGECLVIQSLEQRISRELLQFLQDRTQWYKEKVYLNGQRVTKKQDREIAVICEQPWESMVFMEMSVMDNLCICMDHRISGVWSSKGIRKSIRSMIAEQMGEDVFDKRISELSDRQKSELVYTRVLLQRPQVVFCIQPFKGEDLTHRLLIWELQKRLLDHGIAVVILAVNMADALSIADRVIRIDKNSQIREYERKEFKELPSTIPWYFLYEGVH